MTPIGQVTREYQVKDPQMVAYLGYVQILKGSWCSSWSMSQESKMFELTCWLSSPVREGGRQRTVIQETLKTPRTFIVDNWVGVHQISTTRGGT